MKSIICLTLSIFFSTTTFAKSTSGNNLSIIPIIGFERVQKFIPTPAMKTRMIYGVQALYKLPITTAELEYTHGQDTSNSVTAGASYKDSEDKVKIGLRGNAELGPYFSTYLRGGAQARNSNHTQTTNAGTITSTTSSKVNPYAGTGLAIHFQQYISVSADIIAVYVPTSDPSLSPYEIQPSLGVSVSF